MNQLRKVLQDARVADLGSLPAPRLGPGASVQQAVQALVRARRGALVIVEGLQPIGIFTERDVLYRLSQGPLASREERRRRPVREVMSAPVVTVSRRAQLLEAIALMDRNRHRHLVVVDRHDGLRGLLTTNDLVQFLTDSFPEELVNLPPRLHQRFPTEEGG